MIKLIKYPKLIFFMAAGILIVTAGVVFAASIIVDNGDTASNWVSSDSANTVVSQETSVKQEGTGSLDKRFY